MVRGGSLSEGSVTHLWNNGSKAERRGLILTIYYMNMPIVKDGYTLPLLSRRTFSNYSHFKIDLFPELLRCKMDVLKRIELEVDPQFGVYKLIRKTYGSTSRILTTVTVC